MEDSSKPNVVNDATQSIKKNDTIDPASNDLVPTPNKSDDNILAKEDAFNESRKGSRQVRMYNTHNESTKYVSVFTFDSYTGKIPFVYKTILILEWMKTISHQSKSAWCSKME
jgi:hypothetical protein